MTKHNRSPIEDPIYPFWRKIELGLAKIVGASIIINVMLVVALGGTFYALHGANNQIKDLSKNRVMYGFCDKNNVYASLDKRPEKEVMRYAKDVLLNLYNYDMSTIEENFSYAKKLFDPRVAHGKISETLNNIINATSKNAISQKLILSSQYNISDIDGFYVVTFKAKISRYVADVPSEEFLKAISIKLTKVQPTKARRLGVAVWSIEDKNLK